MKSESKKQSKSTILREQILKSMIASFQIEGINIPINVAEKTLKKIEFNQGK